MNTIEIFTRSYINDRGHWNLSMSTIDSVTKLLDLDANDCISWVILLSNCDERSPYSRLIGLQGYDQFKKLRYYRDCGKVHIIFVDEKLSCSEARVEIYRNIIEYHTQNKSLTELCTYRPDFFMNLDSDDELINYDAILAFSYAPRIKDDLVGFGLEFEGGDPFSDQWTWNLDKFNYSRRYITTETQTMFLFLHSYRVIEYVMQMRRFFKSGPVGDPNESCDDTLMAIEVSYGNTISDRFSIGAICANLIKYKIHPGQVSESQESEFKEWLQSKLHEYGYLYVNSENYYIERDGKLEKFIPVKPQ